MKKARQKTDPETERPANLMQRQRAKRPRRKHTNLHRKSKRQKSALARLPETPTGQHIISEMGTGGELVSTAWWLGGVDLPPSPPLYP